MLMSKAKAAWMSGSCGGAFVARMNSVKALMSSSGSSPQSFDASLSHGTKTLSGWLSNGATERPSEVFSCRVNLLVMPISLR